MRAVLGPLQLRGNQLKAHYNLNYDLNYNAQNPPSLQREESKYTGGMKAWNYRLTVDISKQGRRYVAYSPALDIATTGKTEKETRKRFEELVGIFFDELREAGTLEDVLSELGWKKVRKHWQPPKVSHKEVGIDVPVSA